MAGYLKSFPRLKKALLKTRRLFTYPILEQVLSFIVRNPEYGSVLSLVIPPPELYEGCRPKIVERSGIKFLVDRSDLMGWNVYWAFYDRSRDRLYSMISGGETVMDIGVNLGETLLNMAALVGPDGSVIGFEPDDQNFSQTIVNIGLNNFGNIDLVKLGISDKPESIRIYRVNKFNSGMNRILAAGDECSQDDYVVIETTTIDEFVRSRNIKDLDLIKIDIEGYEMHAFRGGLDTLKRFKPKLFFEIIPERLEAHGSSPNELISLLEDIGYLVYTAKDGRRLTRDHDLTLVKNEAVDLFAIHEASQRLDDATTQ